MLYLTFLLLTTVPQEGVGIPIIEVDGIELNVLYQWIEEDDPLQMKRKEELGGYWKPWLKQYLIKQWDNNSKTNKQGWKCLQCDVYTLEEPPPIRRFPDGRYYYIFNKDGDYCYIVSKVYDFTETSEDREIENRQWFTDYRRYRDCPVTPTAFKRWCWQNDITPLEIK